MQSQYTSSTRVVDIVAVVVDAVVIVVAVVVDAVVILVAVAVVAVAVVVVAVAVVVAVVVAARGERFPKLIYTNSRSTAPGGHY